MEYYYNIIVMKVTGFSVESGATKFVTFPGNQVIKSAQGYNLGESTIALWTQGDFNGRVTSYTGAVASLAAPMASESITGKWNFTVKPILLATIFQLAKKVRLRNMEISRLILDLQYYQHNRLGQTS